MNANQFLNAFSTQLTHAQPSGYGSIWTTAMYHILETIGDEAGYIVNHKGRNREINHLDIAYFPKLPRDGTNWYPPVVIIEHENAYDTEETWRDFWKASLYAVPLRITIGYHRSHEEADASGQEIIERYHTWGIRQLPNGETVLIMGWPQTQEQRQWLVWIGRGEQPVWEHGLL